MNPSLSMAAVLTPAQALAFAGRLTLLTFGVVVFALANVLILQARVGLGAWNTFHYGLTLIAPLSYGQASILVSLAMIGASLLLGVRPGIGTFVNGILTGVFIDLFQGWRFVPWAESPLIGYPMFLVGTSIFGLGTALYIKPQLGAGPRDSFMLGLVRRTGRRVDVVRTAMEIAVLGAGFLMGGPVGGGTVIFSLAVGPVVRAWFRVFHVQVKLAPQPAPSPAGRGER